MEQSIERLIGEIRSAKGCGADLEALKLFAQMEQARQPEFAAYMGLSAAQLAGLGQVLAIHALLESVEAVQTTLEGVDRTEREAEQAVWAFAALPTCCWGLCDAALVKALGKMLSWRLVVEADFVAHHVLETEYFDEMGAEHEPDGVAWGAKETRWFAESDPSRFPSVSRVVIERDEQTGQLVVALPCQGRWQVWKQRWAA